MGSKRIGMGIAAVACALGVAAPAAAQFEDKTCLTYESAFSSKVRVNAIALGFKEVKGTVTDAEFIAGLQSKQWDLIAIELGGKKVTEKSLILDLFEQQHAGGARFLISYSNLEEWPEVWEFLGITNAVDLTNFPDYVRPPKPGNPVWFSNESGVVNNSLPSWNDHGDRLTPALHSIVVTQFPNGSAATVLSADHTRLVNGWNYDEFEGTISNVEDVIYYLMGCSADLNRDGTLDNTDFSVMQLAFASKKGPVNFDFDNAFTVFDFLEFINHFVAGCPQ